MFFLFGLLNSLNLSNPNCFFSMKHSNPTSRQRVDRSGIGAFLFLVIISLLLAVVAALVLRQMFEYRGLYQQSALEATHAVDEKESLLGELSELDAAFQELADEHAVLGDVLGQERQQIAVLRQQISRGTGQASSYRQQIEQLQQQLARHQENVQALVAENQALSGEKAQVTEALNQTKQEYRLLQQKSRQLEQQARVLRISLLEVNPMRHRRRGPVQTSRARHASSLQICFTINENPLAEAGTHEFVFRITGPDGQLLDPSSQTLQLGQQQQHYTFTWQEPFEGPEKPSCAHYSREAFGAGTYELEMYNRETLVGKLQFELN